MNAGMKVSVSYVNFCRLIFGTLLCIGLITGCSSAPPVIKETVFFPPPPNEPKVQFLKSIAGSKDVVENENTFSLILTGQSQEELDKHILKPYGIAYFKGKLYVCDVQGTKVAVIDLPNKKFSFLKGAASGFGKLKKPINLALDSAENIYVVDTIRKEALMYDSAGNFLKTYGKGQVNKPVDVAVEGNELYILDLGDSDIKIFDLRSGNFIRSIGKFDENNQGLAMPTNFTFDGKGAIYVTNITWGNVMKLDKDGHILSKFGKIGDAFGEFTRPKGIAIDAKDRIFVVDGGTQNVQIFNDKGRILMFFGDPPLPNGALNLPVAVAVTTENLEYFQKLAAPDFVLEQVIFVTNQQGRDKISIYGFGHKVGASSSSKTRQNEKKP